jgi:acetyl esterase
MLTASDMAYYNSVYFDSKSYLTDKTARPIISKTLQSIPETHIFVAEFDPLKDDGLFYLAAISKQGGSATFESGDGLVHGYLRARHLSKIANDEFNKILKIINKF